MPHGRGRKSDSGTFSEAPGVFNGYAWRMEAEPQRPDWLADDAVVGDGLG